MNSWVVHHGDCLDVLKTLPDASVDAVVTDPPYGISFMGRKWDYDVPTVEVWAECLRVLKPGGHLLAFAGTRTQHRMCCRIEDAGFEIRDMIAWAYGSGFPKSHNGPWGGTALKPAIEPITVARKPLVGAVAANVQQHGTGGINVDGCRVGVEAVRSSGAVSAGWRAAEGRTDRQAAKPSVNSGRWPANLIHDGSEDATDPLGDAARFFYCAKASKADRDEGCEGLKEESRLEDVGNKWTTVDYRDGHTRNVMARNHHPTVKPTDLMRYLCRLVTPPGGLVLDPFAGSGSTGKAAVLEGFRFVGIEREAAYVDIARRRIAAVEQSTPLLRGQA